LQKTTSSSSGCDSRTSKNIFLLTDFLLFLFFNQQNPNIMKKIYVFMLALLLSGSSIAQEKIYISVGAGFGFGTASTYDLAPSVNKAYPVALGKAAAVNLHAGYFLNSFMAVDLGFSYKIGMNTKIEPEFDIDAVNASKYSPTMKYKGNMFQIVPGIVFSPELDGKIRPYMRAGVIIGVMNSITTNIDNTDGTGDPGDEKLEFILKYSGGIAVGGSLAVGADFALNDLLSLYAEIYYDALSYAPKKGEVKKYAIDGEDKLGDLTTYQKEVEFVKDITNFEPSNDSPDQELKNSYPFNSLGLSIGVKIKL
jgi:hypothetical protein